MNLNALKVGTKVRIDHPYWGEVDATITFADENKRGEKFYDFTYKPSGEEASFEPRHVIKVY